MARLNKQGLDYFPLDVDFFLDDKIRFVVAKYGYAAEAVIIRLLCRIYREGYFTLWNKDVAILFAESLAGCDLRFVTVVVKELIKRDFFDEKIFKSYSLLTSKVIQKRFADATVRRKSIDKVDKYWLLGEVEKEQSVQLSGINVNINSQKKVKEKEIENETENESEKKKPHGEFGNVLLSEREMDTLKTQHTHETIYKYIELIDQFVQRKGEPYKDYYATVKSWIRYDSEKAEKEKARAKEHTQNAHKPNGFTDYAKRTWDYDELLKKEQEYIDKELAKSAVGGQ